MNIVIGINRTVAQQWDITVTPQDVVMAASAAGEPNYMPQDGEETTDWLDRVLTPLTLERLAAAYGGPDGDSDEWELDTVEIDD